MNIAIDLDGVLVEFDRAFHYELTAQGAKVSWPPTRWEWYRPEATEDQIAGAWRATARKDWWQSLAKHPNMDASAWSMLRELCGRATVTFVSARHCSRMESIEWLGDHGIRQAQVIHTARRAKQPVFEALGVEAIVEDHFPTLATSTAPLRYLVHRPYNVGMHHPQVTRVATTGDALQALLEQL